MKNDFKMLYNPFTRIAGWKAFFIGLAVTALASVIGWQSQTMAYGLEIKVTPPVLLTDVLLAAGVGLAAYAVVFYLAALIVARKTRFQDILGTVALARCPYLLAVLAGFAVKEDFDAVTVEAVMENPLAIMEMMNIGSVTILILSFVLVSVWAVALLYNGFKVSTGLNGAKCTLSFIAALLISEIVMLCILW